MKSIHLIIVGKLKDKEIIALENDYLKRICDFKLILHEVKGDGDNRDSEGESIIECLEKISGKKVNSQLSGLYLLAEFGKSFKSSIDFSQWLEQKIEGNGNLYFIIGGASGHGEKIKSLATGNISLSPLTFPHRLARLILIEQLYRAQTIWNDHPYNK